jgi:predicted nucleic acid-binding protein
VNAVIVDTSAWCDYFGGASYPLIDAALTAGHLYLPPIVVAELTSGQLLPKKKQALVDFLRDLPLIEVNFDHWIRVGDLRQKAAAKGLAISTPDAHIAQCSIDFNAVLLSEDHIFRKLKLKLPQLGLALQ